MNLKSADIVAWRCDPSVGWIDRLVGWGERRIGLTGPRGASYYHVAMVAANPKNYYSSQPPKIGKFVCPLLWPANVEFWRLKIPPTFDQLTAMFAYADSRIGEWYPILSVVTFGLVQIGRLEFCSQLVEDTFARGQILLCPDLTFATPDGVLSSSLIARVG